MKSLRDLEKENLWVYIICPCTVGLVVADSKEEAQGKALGFYNGDYSGVFSKDEIFVKKFSMEYIVELMG